MSPQEIRSRNAMYSNEQRVLLKILAGRLDRLTLLSLYVRHLQTENVHAQYENMLTYVANEAKNLNASAHSTLHREEVIDVPRTMERLRQMKPDEERLMLEYAIEFSMDQFGWEETMKEDVSFQTVLIDVLAYHRMGFSTLSPRVIHTLEAALTAHLRTSQRLLNSLTEEDRSMCIDLLTGKKGR